MGRKIKNVETIVIHTTKEVVGGYTEDYPLTFTDYKVMIDFHHGNSTFYRFASEYDMSKFVYSVREYLDYWEPYDDDVTALDEFYSKSDKINER